MDAAPPKRSGPRINEEISVPEVRLVAEDGEQVGVVTTQAALERAFGAGLDLVEVSPNAEPPVCKIIDYGKLKYQEQKKANVARKRQKTIDVKEIKLRPTIEEHDYEVKMRNARRFIDDGDKVKVTLRFRGREMAHVEIGRDLLERIAGDVEEIGKIESMPKMEGRQMIMVVAPLR